MGVCVAKGHTCVKDRLSTKTLIYYVKLDEEKGL